MYGELASIREPVDLSEQEALDSAQAFLTRQGYRLVQRTDTSVTVERHTPDHASGESSLNLTLVAKPQPEGGVQVKVRGNDREGVRERQAQWLEWSESLPKRTSDTEVDHQQEEPAMTPVPPDLAGSEATSDVTAQTSELQMATYEGAGVIFDKQDQLDKIKAGLLPGEQLEAVFDAKGGGTGFVGITSKRVIFQDNAWVMNTKAVVSIPFSRIHTVAAEDQAGLLGGRGFFSSKIVITTSDGPKTFQFRGADKAHIAHDLILAHML